jgi:hypothetical protein
LDKGEHPLQAWAKRQYQGDWVPSNVATVVIDANTDYTWWFDVPYPNECPKPGSSCPSTWELAGNREDDCDHELLVKCVKSGSYCRYEYYYDGTEIGYCPWKKGANTFSFRSPSPGRWGKLRFLETRHYSFNHDPPDDGPDVNGEACTGFHCWRVEGYDCQNSTSLGPWWRKTQSTDWYPECDWDETQGSECDGSSNEHYDHPN